MNALYKTALKNSNIKLYIPESFEWIILSSGLLEDKEIKEILEKPEKLHRKPDIFWLGEIFYEITYG